MISRALHTATLLTTGKVLAAGGYPDGLASAELYDSGIEPSPRLSGKLHPLTQTNTMKTLHSSLLFFSAALLLNQPCTGAPGQWEETGSMVNGRAGQTATLMPNGDVLVIGGLSVADGHRRTL